MNIYKSFENIDYNKNTVLTVGTFDGVHKGHQMIIDKLLYNAKVKNYRSVLLTFDPHPQIILNKGDRKPIKLLTTIEERLWLFEKYGIENVLIIPFSIEFSLTPPEIFVKEYLVEKIGLKKILIGFDHLFGKDREGNEDLLKNLGSEFDFEIEKVNALLKDSSKVSSTLIRNSLAENNLLSANEMLGYNYFVSGKVVKGDGRGRKLGFPTVNLKTDEHKQLPGYGVYLVRSKIAGHQVYGIASLGVRPTFSPDSPPTFEVYYLNFDADLYNSELKVEFLQFIRQELKFNSVDDLVRKIEEDRIKSLELIKTFYN